MARMLASYFGARAEEMFELLFEAMSRSVADETARAMQTTRVALTTEIENVRDATAATQRESARMGRELMRTGASLEDVHQSLTAVGSTLQRIEAVLAVGPTDAQVIRDVLLSDLLGDILATMDGLEAAIDEARTIADALAQVGRQIDDPVVRRWWRALNEASGTKRSLPSVPASEAEHWVRGVELTYRRLLDMLARRGIDAIEAAGKPFDPHLHEAVAVMACSPEQEGIVLREERKGYRAADRVIRLAQVVVGKPELAAEKRKRKRRRVDTASDNREAAMGNCEANEEVADE